MSLFNLRSAQPKRRRRLALASDVANPPLPPVTRVQPEEGPLHFVCPWGYVGLNSHQIAEIHHFQLLSEKTPLDEVREQARMDAKARGLTRIRVFNLNVSTLAR